MVDVVTAICAIKVVLLFGAQHLQQILVLLGPCYFLHDILPYLKECRQDVQDGVAALVEPPVGGEEDEEEAEEGDGGQDKQVGGHVEHRHQAPGVHCHRGGLRRGVTFPCVLAATSTPHNNVCPTICISQFLIDQPCLTNIVRRYILLHGRSEPPLPSYC